MFIEERQQLILEQLAKHKKVVVVELAQLLKVSVDTIRRDLIILENNGLLKRTRGGAICPNKLRAKHTRNYNVRDIKEVNPYYDVIAKQACLFINENDTIYLAGTSIDYLMIKYLPKDISYTVITNSVITADELKGFENIEVFITCGKVRGRGSMNDPLVIDFIRNIRIDKAFISGPFISANFGISTTTFETAKLQKAVIDIAKQVICPVPNVKFGIESFAKIADIKDINMVITDSESLEEEIIKIEELGVQVVIAQEEN